MVLFQLRFYCKLMSKTYTKVKIVKYLLQKKGGGGLLRYQFCKTLGTHLIYREGGPGAHEPRFEVRQIVAPQHIVKVFLDTRCSYAFLECSKYITLVKVVAPM